MCRPAQRRSRAVVASAFASLAARVAMAEEDLVADLFGDFNSEEEDAATQPASSSGAAASGEGRQFPRLKRGGGDEADAAPEAKARRTDLDAAGGDSHASGADRAARREARKADKKRKREGMMKFFDTEAAEGGASGDDDDGSDLDGFLDDSGKADTEARRGNERRSHEECQAQMQEVRELRKDMESRGPESGANRVYGSFLDEMEAKYKAIEESEGQDLPGTPRARGGPRISRGSDQGSIGDKEKTNAFIVPDAKDPKLWCVKTFAPEKELCLSLLLKFGLETAAGRPVDIYSVFWSQHLRGYIYVEAEKEANIRTFTKGIRGISQWSIKLVPPMQMPQVFTATRFESMTHEHIKVGDWCRIRRGTNKNDLAMVWEIKDDLYTVKVKPRLDFGIGAVSNQGAKDKASRLARRRPVARWFNRTDVEQGGLIVNVERRMTGQGYLGFYLVNDECFRDGFLFKAFKIGWLDTGDKVKAQENELQDFRFAPVPDENTRPAMDLEVEDSVKMPPPSIIPKKAAAQKIPFIESDIVIVTSGDLKNLRAKVVQYLSGSPTVHVQPHNVGDDGLEELHFAIDVLSKYFEVGDHIKVVAGEHEGDTGHIVKVFLEKTPHGDVWGPGAYVAVVSDTLEGDFKVRVNHVRLSLERPEMVDKLDEFSLGKLVRVGGNQVCLLTRIEARSRAWVLTSENIKRCVSFGELEPVVLPGKSMYKRSVWTEDRKGNRLVPECIVKAPRGVEKSDPIICTVLYINGRTCFLRANEQYVGERAYMVADGRKCEFVWKVADEKEEARVKKQALEDTKEVGGTGLGTQIRMASQLSFVKETSASTEEFAESLNVLGAPVLIVGGSYKGLRGEARAFLGEQVRISLLAKNKLVLVPTRFVAPDHYKTKSNLMKRSGVPLPTTPKGHDSSIRMAPTTPLPSFSLEDDALDTTKPPSEDDLWSADFLKAPLDKAFFNTEFVPEKALQNGEAEQEGAIRSERGSSPSRVDSAATPQSGEDAADGGPRKKKEKRPSRLPAANVGATPSPTSHVASQMSVDEQFQSEPVDLAEEVRAPFMEEGVGVEYQRGGQDCHGWILKIYSNIAHVCPGEGAERKIVSIDSKLLTPWQTTGRGDEVLVFDGPRRGQFGKVVGVQSQDVYIALHEDSKGGTQGKITSGKKVKVNKKDIARYKFDFEDFKSSRLGQPAEWIMASSEHPVRPAGAVENDAVERLDEATSEHESHKFRRHLTHVDAPESRQSSIMGDDGDRLAELDDFEPFLSSQPGSAGTISEAPPFSVAGDSEVLLPPPFTPPLSNVASRHQAAESLPCETQAAQSVRSETGTDTASLMQSPAWGPGAVGTVGSHPSVASGDTSIPPPPKEAPLRLRNPISPMVPLGLPMSPVAGSAFSPLSPSPFVSPFNPTTPGSLFSGATSPRSPGAGAVSPASPAFSDFAAPGPGSPSGDSYADLDGMSDVGFPGVGSDPGVDAAVSPTGLRSPALSDIGLPGLSDAGQESLSGVPTIGERTPVFPAMSDAMTDAGDGGSVVGDAGSVVSIGAFSEALHTTPVISPPVAAPRTRLLKKTASNAGGPVPPPPPAETPPAPAELTPFVSAGAITPASPTGLFTPYGGLATPGGGLISPAGASVGGSETPMLSDFGQPGTPAYTMAPLTAGGVERTPAPGDETPTLGVAPPPPPTPPTRK